MPRSVAVNVKNCAIAKQTFAAMSLSFEISIDVNANVTATKNDKVAIVFSSFLVI